MHSRSIHSIGFMAISLTLLIMSPVAAGAGGWIEDFASTQFKDAAATTA